MKKILSGTVAAIALAAFATPAAAQTAQLHYAGGPVSPLTNPSGFGGLLGAAANELALLGNIGTRYTAFADAPSDSETATPTVNVVFSLSGTVNRDCSFYAGNTNSARTIDFGVIGVRTGNNENVNSAFEMVGPAAAAIDTIAKVDVPIVQHWSPRSIRLTGVLSRDQRGGGSDATGKRAKYWASSGG